MPTQTYRITYREAQLRTVVIEADSESAARQAFIDHHTHTTLIEVEASEVLHVELADDGWDGEYRFCANRTSQLTDDLDDGRPRASADVATPT